MKNKFQSKQRDYKKRCARLTTGSNQILLQTQDKLIVILGPTTSGKSELAVKIAKKYNGEIISADSRQVYKGLDIGSGKVLRDSIFGTSDTLKDVGRPYIYKNIPHYLIDVASPRKIFTVSQYQKLAKKALTDILKRGKIPIICGGTGLYIDSIIYNTKFPEVPPQPKLRKKLEKLSTEELFKKLQKLDPRRAKNIDCHNRRRLVRALEIIITTGKPVPNIRINQLNQHKSVSILKIGIKKSPEELKKLIKKRLLARLRGKNNIIKEVKNLRKPFGFARGKQGLNWQRLDDLGLEYRYVSRYLRDLITKKEMIEILEKEIYRYAKRQMTWFKRDPKIIWVENYKETQKLTRGFLK